jgi:hypothetical protein
MASAPEGYEWLTEDYGVARSTSTGELVYVVGGPLITFSAPSESTDEQTRRGLELLWALVRRRSALPYNLVGAEVQVMRWVRAQVIGQLGTREQLVHTLNLTLNGDAGSTPLPVDATALRGVAELVRDRWAAFWTTATTGAGTSPQSHFTQELSYTRVAAAVVERTAPTSKTDPDAGPVTTVLPAEYAEWVTPIMGSNATATLPFQCAFVVTLITRERGARTRGRLYLGPLSASELGAEGKVGVNTRRDLTKGFGLSFIEPLRATTPWQLTVISGRNNAGREVVRTSGGLTIDTQRRRREALPELPVIEWTSPTI